MNIQNFLNIEIFSIRGFTLTVSAVLAFFITLLIANFIRFFLKKIILRKTVDQYEAKNRYAIYRLASYFIWIVGIITGLEVAGLSVNILLAGSAALLVGIGLGLQHTFNDIVSGLILLFEGSIRLNDIVYTDGEHGKIIEIGLRTSKIMTRDNIVLIIPNSKFIVEKVTNWSYSQPATRFAVRVGVSYKSDVELVKKVLIDSTKGIEGILDEPKPSVFLKNFGESSLDFDLFFWTDQPFEVILIQSNIRYRIIELFKENNIEIPYPQLDLHYKSKI